MKFKFRLKEDIDDTSEDTPEFDSVGNELTIEQSEFFKNSVVRNQTGRLIVCYHGSDNDRRYDTIDTNKSSYSTPSSYFSDSLSFAISFSQRYEGNGNVYECYLNITNPLFIDARGKDFYSVPLNGESLHISDVAKYAYERNYDGVIVKNIKEYGNNIVTDFITFRNNQIKLISNKNPTNSEHMNG